MVNKHLYKTNSDPEDAPPPMDESWWDAIMTEESSPSMPAGRYGATTLGMNSKAPLQRMPSEPADVDWDLAIELFDMDRIVTLEVCGCNRGGLLVCGEGLQGFVPVSHLVEMPVEKSGAEQELYLKTYMGKQLKLKIIECDPSRGRVVFSERAALAQPGSRNMLLHHLQAGECIEGTVTNITEFGVFVDLGGVEGLIHVSEISWGRVRHPADVVQYGDRVKVHVIQVEPDRSRVALSMKRLYPNPWETAEERYFPGQVTDAVITSLVPFGAFARLEEGLDGLIHVSEIVPGGQVTNLSEVLHEGQKVTVRVLHVDATKQRLGLSMLINEE
jgi:small subunit ribosomal protein S1